MLCKTTHAVCDRRRLLFCRHWGGAAAAKEPGDRSRHDLRLCGRHHCSLWLEGATRLLINTNTCCCCGRCWKRRVSLGASTPWWVQHGLAVRIRNINPGPSSRAPFCGLFEGGPSRLSHGNPGQGLHGIDVHLTAYGHNACQHPSTCLTPAASSFLITLCHLLSNQTQCIRRIGEGKAFATIVEAGLAD